MEEATICPVCDRMVDTSWDIIQCGGKCQSVFHFTCSANPENIDWSSTKPTSKTWMCRRCSAESREPRITPSSPSFRDPSFSPPSHPNYERRGGPSYPSHERDPYDDPSYSRHARDPYEDPSYSRHARDPYDDPSYSRHARPGNPYSPPPYSPQVGNPYSPPPYLPQVGNPYSPPPYSPQVGNPYDSDAYPPKKQCSTCGEPVANLRNTLRCRKCMDVHHYFCVEFTKQKFEQLPSEKKASWKCRPCKKKDGGIVTTVGKRMAKTAGHTASFVGGLPLAVGALGIGTVGWAVSSVVGACHSALGGDVDEDSPTSSKFAALQNTGAKGLKKSTKSGVKAVRSVVPFMGEDD